MLKIQEALMLGAVTIAAGCADHDRGQSARNFLPPPGFQGVAVKGEALFNRHCSSCHGAGALGSDQGPPLIHKIYEPHHHSDISFFMAAKNGTPAHHWQFGDMPPVPGVRPEDVAHIVAYVRREQRAAGIR